MCYKTEGFRNAQKRWSYHILGCIWHGTYCSGTFYHVRYTTVYRHVMFLAFGTYVAALCIVSCHDKKA
jgi:hypothetical protein